VNVARGIQVKKGKLDQGVAVIEFMVHCISDFGFVPVKLSTTNIIS